MKSLRNINSIMSPYVSFNMTHKYKSDGVKFRINYQKFGGMAKIIARNMYRQSV